MGKYFVTVEPEARKELQFHHKSGDKNTIKKIEQIFEELAEHPETGIGSPEQLKYRLSGYWSRRINQKDRLVYRIFKDTVSVVVVSAKGHYLDK
jgi:toxin YoeB